MSRSRRRTPVKGITTASSEKEDKVRAHREERRKVRQAIADAVEPPHPKAFGNPWTTAKDGKRRYRDPPARVLRK
jgi:hypothetical protein